MNPLDYIFNALNVVLEPLDSDGGEYEILIKYILNTWEGKPNKMEVKNIFKL